MSSQLVEAPTHPVAAFADRLSVRLDDLAESPLLAMTPSEKRRSLVAFARAEAKLAALRLRLLADADTTGACLEAGAANAAGWMKVETQQSRRDARSDLELAHRLDSLPLLLAGMTTGAVNAAQARAVVKSLDRLPTSGEFAVSLDQRAQAEAHLVGLCCDVRRHRDRGPRPADLRGRRSRGRRGLRGQACSRPKRPRPLARRPSRCGPTTRAWPTAGSGSPPVTARCSARRSGH